MKFDASYYVQSCTVVFKVRGRPEMLILISRAATLVVDFVQTVRVPAWKAPEGYELVPIAVKDT